MGMELPADEAGFHEMMDSYVSDSQVASYICEALKSVAQGDDEDYNQLIEVITHTEINTPDQEALIVTSLRALCGSVSHIDVVRHEALLHAIFQTSLWNHGPDVMDAFVELMVSLAASGGKFVDACLETLVSNFLPPPSMLHFLKNPRSLARKTEVLDKVHSALRAISDLVPLTPKRLEPILSQGMLRLPIAEASAVLYVENLLRLESGELGEFLGSMMIKGIVDRLVDLDMEIVLEPNSIQEDSAKGIFDMELEDVDEYEDEEKIGHEVSRGTLSRLGNNAVADKLDSLIAVTCAHLNSCAKAGRLGEVFKILMESFEKTVMLTVKSKFVQFVVFHACSLDSENCAVRFANILVDIFLDQSNIHDRRMAAVSYLASYLSRGRFLSTSFVANVLKRLVGWCFDYCKFRHGEINPTVHRVFYSGCQAIMYVLCFRMRSMLDIPHLKSLLFDLPLESILCHSWNPLKVCLPSIVEEFLRQAKAASLFTVSQKFLFNNLLESDLSKAFGGQKRLDMFFPFDPCLLKKTDRVIRPNFMFWSMVKTTYADEENDNEDFDDEDEFADERVGSFIENGMILESEEEEEDLLLDEFELSMNKMSITPMNGSLKNGLPSTRMPARIQPSTSPW